MSKRVVIIPDTQIPYHDERRLRAVIRFIGEIQPDEVIHIGDVMDYPQPSRWSKGTAAEFEGDVYADSQRARAILLEPLREAFSGPIGFHSGNHDERPRDYLSKYAPALAKTGEFDLEKLLGLEEYDIQVLPDFYQVAPGWLTTHGHRGGIRLTQKAGQTALGAAIRFGQSVVMGHTHRMAAASHSYGVGNNVSTLWGIEVGNLMDYRKAHYLKGAAPNWQKGFVILDISGSRVQPQLVDLKGRTFLVDGKDYTVL